LNCTPIKIPNPLPRWTIPDGNERLYYHVPGDTRNNNVASTEERYAKMHPSGFQSAHCFNWKFANPYQGILDLSRFVSISGEKNNAASFCIRLGNFADDLRHNHPKLCKHDQIVQRLWSGHLWSCGLVNALYAVLNSGQTSEAERHSEQKKQSSSCQLTFATIGFRSLVWTCVKEGQPLTVDRIIYSRSILYDTLKETSGFNRGVIGIVFTYHYINNEELERWHTFVVFNIIFIGIISATIFTCSDGSRSKILFFTCNMSLLVTILTRNPRSI